MREVGIVSFAQARNVRHSGQVAVEMLMPVITEAVESSGIPRREIGFWCSGSCDYMAGQPFSFVAAVDAIGAWPPVAESHVEMDGAWALYEAWVKLQLGDVDSALVFGYGKSSSGLLRRIMTLQMDPFNVAPLWPDSVSVAALQARALLEGTAHTERDMAAVVTRSRRSAQANPNAQLSGTPTVDELLTAPMLADPLRRHDCPPVSDGASAVVLAADGLARSVCSRPAWIRGIDHRIEAHGLGLRDLTRCPSAALAAHKAGADDSPFDVAEVHAPFSHQELMLTEAIGLGPEVTVNPSGGALCANPMMAAGLIRFGEAARRIWEGGADRALAHATSGPCLQQNLVCVLEGD
jgi:acetyl-CoA acetyltransferase